MQRHDAQWDFYMLSLSHRHCTCRRTQRGSSATGGIEKRAHVNLRTEKPCLGHWTLTKNFDDLTRKTFIKKSLRIGPPLGPDSALVCPTLQQASREIRQTDATSEAAPAVKNGPKTPTTKPHMFSQLATTWRVEKKKKPPFQLSNGQWGTN